MLTAVGEGTGVGVVEGVGVAVAVGAGVPVAVGVGVGEFCGVTPIGKVREAVFPSSSVTVRWTE